MEIVDMVTEKEEEANAFSVFSYWKWNLSIYYALKLVQSHTQYGSNGSDGRWGEMRRKEGK